MMEGATLHATRVARESVRLLAVSAIQRQKLLPEIVAFTLEANQAHWNMSGPGFLSLHSLTDEMAADRRICADRLGKRAVALRVHFDAQPITDAAATASFRLGRVSDVEAVGTLCLIDRVATATSGVLDRSCRPMPSRTI
jgi:hypothetical protein